jgi:hypothetical protein
MMEVDKMTFNNYMQRIYDQDVVKHSRIQSQAPATGKSLGAEKVLKRRKDDHEKG